MKSLNKLKSCIIISLLLTFWLHSHYLYAKSFTISHNPIPTFSEMQQAKIGEQFYQKLLAANTVIADPIIAQYIKKIGDHLVTYTNAQDKSFHFFVLDSNSINAFSGPGGYIGINRGLIENCHNESELAAVIAHEISHVTQGHISQIIIKAKKIKMSTIAGLLAAVALGTKNTNAAAGAITATMSEAKHHMLSFSRSNEYEADRLGIALLYRAGYDPYGMVDFFQKILQIENENGALPEFQSDHPLTQDRIAEANSMAAQYPKKSYHTSIDFYLVRTRLQALSMPNDHDTVEYFQKQLVSHQYPNRNAADYGYSLALMRDEQNKAAYAILKRLSEQHPDEVIYAVTLANCAQRLALTQQAIDIMHQTYQHDSQNYLVTTYYANILAKNKHYQDAINIINRHRLKYPDDPIPYHILSRAQGKAGHIADAYQTRALYFSHIGAYNLAADQIKIAMRLPDNDAITQSKLDAQLKTIYSH